MNKLYLAILWHQHQPYYKNLVTNELLMPWVRLHAVKDYIGMIDIAEEFPDLKLNFNYVPSLIEQIDDYLEGNCTERALEHARKPADGLTEEETHFILDNFFMANWDTMIYSHPRYGELLRKRNFDRLTVKEAAKRFRTQDILDLQVWANLAWIHKLEVERDDFLKGLIEKDRNFTEEDKLQLLDKHMEIMARVIPKHKELQDDGRIEISTTPYYHPILPLLCNMDSARTALPKLALPDNRYPLEEDARKHLEQSVELYRRKFGCEPRGLWPSEGSVSPEMAPLVAEAGFSWMATDEEILARSLEVQFHRDGHQRINRPDILYQPYRVQAGSKDLSIIFRDHFLSDQIGFKYQWTSAENAANDFLTRLWNIRQSGPKRDNFVAVILDGENAWESYHNGGIDFLRALYRRICSEAWVEPVRIGDYLEEHQPSARITRLFPGSWISHNYATWVGHKEKNAGWEHLFNTRKFLTSLKPKAGSEEWMKAAWKELHIAEGSDWFWWYGDDHFSGNDEAFDQLFRTHLKNVYELTGNRPPQVLDNAITKVDHEGLYTHPRAFLDIRLDGKQTHYFEWAAAGHYDYRKDRGAMHKVSDNVVSGLYFGFDQRTLFMRFDPAMEAPEGEAQPIEILITFLKDQKPSLRLHVSDLALGFPIMTLEGETLSEPLMLQSVAFHRILELSCPFDYLGYEEGEYVEFFVEVQRNGETIQRIPENTVIAFTVPSKDFEREMWQV